MRNATCSALVDLYKKRDFVFLTGDLGFMALEALKAAMGDNFINAGVAEQNMVSVAAGIASAGLQSWAYSIAPFIYARPFEQIRNDICIHDFDVKLIGNGGGYGYGSMGSTHHALEDYGVLLTLPNMHVFIPAFAEDVSIIVSKMADMHHPAYLRLGRCEKPKAFELPEYSGWRRLVTGHNSVILAIGPLVGGVMGAVLELPEANRPELWVLTELPIPDILPIVFLESIDRCGHLIVIEEHIAQGSVGQMMAHRILRMGIKLSAFHHVCAKGYPSGYYGSQTFHRKECGLDPKSIIQLAAGRSKR
jgi:transketolase